MNGGLGRGGGILFLGAVVGVVVIAGVVVVMAAEVVVVAVGCKGGPLLSNAEAAKGNGFGSGLLLLPSALTDACSCEICESCEKNFLALML